MKIQIPHGFFRSDSQEQCFTKTRIQNMNTEQLPTDSRVILTTKTKVISENDSKIQLTFLKDMLSLVC